MAYEPILLIFRLVCDKYNPIVCCLEETMLTKDLQPHLLVVVTLMVIA